MVQSHNVQTEIPPAYSWSTSDVLALAVGATFVGLILASLCMNGGSGLVLYIVGIAAAVKFWPEAYDRAVQYKELRKFRKEIETHEG